MPITAVKIFPSIGIARLGNSPSEFFIGPEIPGVRPVPTGGYRDSACRIKRQAARFRIFGYDGSNLVQEITAADAQISWTTDFAAKKASRNRSPARTRIARSATHGRHRPHEPGGRPWLAHTQRAYAEAAFNTGRFRAHAGAAGRAAHRRRRALLVLGGFGRRGRTRCTPIVDFANNDNWFDDVSDGPVTATVTGLAGAAGPLAAAPAWVICLPPDFAPPIESVTTLYEVLFQVAGTTGCSAGQPTRRSPPTYSRCCNGSSTCGARTRVWAAPTRPSRRRSGLARRLAQRQAIVDKIRDPNNPGAAAGIMPMLWDDDNGIRQVITKAQYAILKKWRDGTFVDDWTGVPPVPGGAITPDGLTRAALEACKRWGPLSGHRGELVPPRHFRVQ